ncbi:hypothetical protein U1E44_13465 [Arenibacter sp. GZD96]|uniref:hypothetical protein n=1 Tax=Aurantibrevibacter litoralis TaxID=3106030 RepID=UPI002AFF5436|nr:hypothetical protein [Arenibacter sp. GZD-96]MEA1787103.1 hypothetical protein [Arenibacter sp. GZD-96]
MKKRSLMVVTAMLLLSGSIFSKDLNPTEKLSKQIGAILKEAPFKLNHGELTADVRFTLNAEKEIVVLSVVAQDDKVAAFVKSRLNYQKVEIVDHKEGKLYTVRIRITAAEV